MSAWVTRGILCSLILFSPSTVVAIDIGWEAELEQYTSYNTDEDHFSRVRFESELEATAYLHRHWLAQTAYRFWLDPYLWNSKQYPNRVRQDERSQFDIRELYFEYRQLPFIARVGTQEVVWGEALNPFSADLLHPKDFRDFFLNDLSWQRIPQTGLWLTYDPGSWSLSFVYFPFSEMHRLPEPGAEFFLASYSVESLGLPRPERPSRFEFDSPTLGLKLGLRPGPFDLNLMAVLQPDNQPFYNSTSSELERDMIGSFAFTGSYAFGYWILRTESLLFVDRQLNLLETQTIEDTDIVETQQLAAVEWDPLGWLHLSTQLLWNKKFSCNDKFFEECQSLLQGFLFRLRQLPEDIEIEPQLWYDVPERGGWLSLRVYIPLGDRVSLIPQVDQFFGDGRFEELRNRDQIGLRLRARF